MFTVDDKYFRQNRENLQLPFQMQLPKNPKIYFYCFFIAFLESTLNFEHFQKTMGLIVQVFLKLLTLKDVIT